MDTKCSDGGRKRDDSHPLRLSLDSPLPSGFISSDKVDCVEEERMDKKRRYANNTYTDDEDEYSWEDYVADDHKGFIVEEECCEEKGDVIGHHEADDLDQECSGEHNVDESEGEKTRGYADDEYVDDEAEYSRDEDYSTHDDKGVFVEKECTSRKEKGGNVTGDEKECCYEKSCKVNGELSENKGCYWDIWSERWTNDKAIYD
nr:hypothetical protein [Tanacetum cinerariifolium]